MIGAAAARASNQENLTKSGPAAPPLVAQNPKQAAGEWLRKHKDLSSTQQEMLLEKDPGFQGLSRERQQQMKEHLREFNNMPQEQRQRWIDRMDALEKLSPQQKETLERSVVQLRNMPEPRRNAVRRALAQLAQIPEEERAKVLESDRFKQAFSPEERSMMKNLFDAGIRPNGMPIEPK